ncbi:hypothetical protein FB565_006840 [Actinoplanes lutulentus]|uniref:DUF6745 domain-containing protein n=1 Tax=Actinoplanes lutulentus TaxID=1287878 RepID=A0A327Z4R6_9ACTN|nr:hypothetical protein [Actinoplanes lutulentus]MBB2947072.1 hypothetical protein [Actinoplanes lutulentus]RAK30569.1 hypothetical protein B0I29_116228 [Actinoplanes lutulentus]
MQLTHAHEAMASAIEDQWLAAAVQTGAAVRDEAEAGVRAAYTLAGLPEPEKIYWLGSPRAGAAAAAILAVAPELGPQTAAGFAGVSAGTAAGLAEVSAGTAAGLAGMSAGTAAGLAGVSAGTAWLAEVHADLRRQGWTPGERLGSSLRRQIRTEPWAAARKSALEALGADGWAQLSAAAGRRSWGLVMDLIAARLRLRLGEDLTSGLGDAGPAVRRMVLDAVYGQHDGTWLSTFDAADRIAPGAGLMAPLTGLAEVARHAGWWWAYENVAILTERPTLLERDNVGRLHRGEGAAMEFPDGYGLWAWRGMPIPADLAAELPRLTVERIRDEPNAEIRRVMLEHFGYERYLREAGARTMGSDEAGTLWYLDLPGDEPLVMVEVVNSTPEPDGTSRVYWLRVPPSTRTAREGVAWTFGLTAEEYQPLIQT